MASDDVDELASEMDLDLDMPETEDNETLETAKLSGKTSAKTGKGGHYVFTDGEIESIISESREVMKASACFTMLVLGPDGTGKSGIVLDYLSNQEKPSLILDLDGGCGPLITSYYKDNPKVIVINPTQNDERGDIDYDKTLSFILGVIRYLKHNENYKKYAGVVLDGISSFLTATEYLMKIDHNIAIDGTVKYRYWMNRNKKFLETCELIKSIPVMDKFYIAHEDFITDDDSAKVKLKLNRLIHQRIICRKIVDGDDILFKAKIDKSKYDLRLEGKEYKFAKVSGEIAKWNCGKIFKGLKGDEKNG